MKVSNIIMFYFYNHNQRQIRGSFAIVSHAAREKYYVNKTELLKIIKKTLQSYLIGLKLNSTKTMK